MADPALFEPRGVLLGHRRRDRGHVDEHGTALHRICRPAVEEHLAHDRPAVENGEDVVGTLNAVDRAVGDPGAVRGEQFGLGAGAVPDRGREAGLDQVGGHRRAHDASAQKGDVVSHWRVPPWLNGTYLTHHGGGLGMLMLRTARRWPTGLVSILRFCCGIDYL